MFNFRKAITMTKFESTINGGSLARVGIILALCGAAFWFVQARNATPTATANSSTSVESAPVELLPGATIWVDTVIGQVPLTIVSIANGQATLTDADGDEHVMSANALAWGALVDDIDQADEQAALHLAAVERRRASGYYEAHAPAGWCNAADCPTVQTPARATNYAPEHWTPEARAALQYPAARAAQQWANEHLYSR
jgi:hypothetical protein